MGLVDKKHRAFAVGDVVYLACIVDELHETRDGDQFVVLRVLDDTNTVDRKRIDAVDPKLLLTKSDVKDKTK